jgi:deacetoxycephalosporin-C hydroxylase
MADVTVPRFSLAELRSGTRREEFRRCVTTLGVFYLTGCGTTEDQHRLAIGTALDFFAHGTLAEKRAVTTTDPTMRRGYSALEAESTARVTHTGAYTDYSMAFSMGVSDNLFPDRGFERVWTGYFDRLYTAAREIARIVLAAAGSPADGDLDALGGYDPVLRVRSFPEVPEHRAAEYEPRRMASHYDLSVITLVYQSPCPNGFVSLAADVGGEPVELPAAPDAVIVLCGAIAPLLTQGAIPVPRHHVRSPGTGLRRGSERTSSVFFLRPTPRFSFSVAEAHQYGLAEDVAAETGTITFGEWIGTNYVALHATVSPDLAGVDKERGSTTEAAAGGKGKEW